MPGAPREAKTGTPLSAVVSTSAAASAGAAASSCAAVGSDDRRKLMTEPAPPCAAFSTPSPRSPVSTAPVGSAWPQLVLSPGASTQESQPAKTSAAVSSDLCGVILGLADGRDVALRDVMHESSAEKELDAALVGGGGDESSPIDGSSATDAGSEGINEEDDSDEILMESSYLHSRPRSRVLKAPVTTRPPPPVVPSDATVEMVLELVSNNRPKQHVRAVIALMSAEMRRVGSRTVQSMLLTLQWWPRKSACEVWPLSVVVGNCVLDKALPRYEVTEGSITVTLERWSTNRDDPPTNCLANILLLAAMVPKATKALKAYILMITPQPLHKFARPAPRLESLAELSAIRAGPRVAPTPGELARRRADPRQPGTSFYCTPRRLRDWVSIGFNPPTHHPSRMPPLPVRGSSLPPSRGVSGASGSGAVTASPANVLGDTTEAFDAQSVQAAVLAARRVIDSCAPTRSPDRDPRSTVAVEAANPPDMPTRRTRQSLVTPSTAAAAIPATETRTASARPQVGASLRAAATPPTLRAIAADESPATTVRGAATRSRAASNQTSTACPAADARDSAAAAPAPSATPSAAARARTAASPFTASAPGAVVRAASQPEASPPAAARPAPASASTLRPEDAPPNVELPDFSAVGSRWASPEHSDSRRVSPGRTGAESRGRAVAPLESIPPDTPSPDNSAGDFPRRPLFSRRTVSWADACGVPRAAGGDEVEVLCCVWCSTISPFGAPGVARRLEQDNVGGRACLRVRRRRSFGSGRALANVEAAVAGVASASAPSAASAASASASIASASPSSQHSSRLPGHPSPSTTSAATNLESTTVELPLQTHPPSTVTSSMRLLSAAAQSVAILGASPAAVSSGVAPRQPSLPADYGATSDFDHVLPWHSARASAFAAVGSSTLGGTAAAKASATPSMLSASSPPDTRPEVSTAKTSTRSGENCVVTATSVDEAKAESETKKRLVETCSSSARPPVMPTSAEAGQARTPSLHHSVGAASDSSVCQL